MSSGPPRWKRPETSILPVCVPLTLIAYEPSKRALLISSTFSAERRAASGLSAGLVDAVEFAAAGVCRAGP